jgi:hypothetical protein
MSGLHRKPSTTGRTVAKVAATGALLGGAGLALSAPAANAATDSQWDKVASCESGGNWAINTGNGYHGGLQFSQSTWASYGGTQYAPTANQASKAAQIAIGEKVLAGQGHGAWPVCGGGLGAATPRSVEPSSVSPAVKPLPGHKAVKPLVQTQQVGKGSKQQYVQSVIRQAQAKGHKLDPAMIAMLEQAAAKGY